MINILKSLRYLTCRVSHGLDFTNCTHLVPFSMSFCPLHFLQVGIWLQRLDRLRFNFFGKSVGGNVFFHHKAQTVQLCLFLWCCHCWGSLHRPFHSLGAAELGYPHSVIPSLFICLIASIKRHFPSFTGGLPSGTVERKEQCLTLSLY